MVEAGENSYELVTLRCELEQAYFDIEFAGITEAEKLHQQLDKEKTLLGILRAVLIVLYRLAILYRRIKRIQRRFNKTQRKHDKAITKAAKNG